MMAGLDEHPLLSKKSEALAAATPNDKFVAQADLAESLLGIPATLPSDAAVVAKLMQAAALQVNFQLDYGVEPAVIETTSSRHTGNSITYRDRLLDPRAVALVAEAIPSLRHARYGSITSVRFPKHV